VRCDNTTQKIAAETWLNRNRTTRYPSHFEDFQPENKRSTRHALCVYFPRIGQEARASLRRLQKTFMGRYIITLWTRLIFSKSKRNTRSKPTPIKVRKCTRTLSQLVTAPIEIWLILPVVICLFQGLSHACLRITALQDSAHGSLHQT
jgi:hypothetical protein